MENTCSHLDQALNPSGQNSPQKHSKKDSKTRGCEECLKTGDSWVHLRECTACGHIGCCDSSKNRHATRHYHATKHPVIRSAEPDETWLWCYVDERTFDPRESKKQSA